MIHRFGLEFPDGVDSATMLLAAYRVTTDPERKSQFMYQAIQALWPNDQYKLHYWVRRRVEAWCSSNFIIWAGAAATAKSTDAAVISLVHWLSSPHNSQVILCSTTYPMLERRVWGQLIHFYNLLSASHKLGRYIRSKRCIIMEDGGTSNSGIFGVAIQRSTVKEALSNLIGVHNTHNVLIIDEMQSIREAAMESIANLSASGEFIFLGCGNPSSRLDPLGRAAEPSAGWGSVTADTAPDWWETRRGRAYYFDGLKSPAIVEEGGEENYPFLLNQKAVDQLAAWSGINSPQFWQMRRGFWPPEGLERTIFTESAILAFKMMDSDVIWQKGFICYGGIDASYSAGGDRTVLQIVKVGIDGRDNKTKVLLEEPIIIDLNIAEGEYLSETIACRVYEECRKRAISAEQLALDTTGTQVVLADILDQKFAKDGMGRVYRVVFGGRASERPMQTDFPDKASDLFSNRVTELWQNLFYMAKHNNIRGCSLDLCKELCSRVLDTNLKLLCLESKVKMKVRTGYSPDLADATCVVIALLKERFGIYPDGTADNVKMAVDRTLNMKSSKEVDVGDIYDYSGGEIIQYFD